MIWILVGGVVVFALLAAAVTRREPCRHEEPGRRRPDYWTLGALQVQEGKRRGTPKRSGVTPCPPGQKYGWRDNGPAAG